MKLLLSLLFIGINLNSYAQGNNYSNLVYLQFPVQERYYGKSNIVNFSTNKINNPTIELAESIDRLKPIDQVLNISNTIDPNARFFALIIGISDYQNNEGITDLDRPTRDVQALKNTLLNYSFESQNILTLQNPTRATIIDTFDDLSKKLNPNTNLLVFYAGHGVWDENLQVGYWLPADARIDRKSSWISNSDIKDYIAGIKSKHTLLITDACFSGSIFKSRGAEAITDVSFARLYKYQSRKAMTSGNLSTVPDQSKFFDLLNKRLLENQQPYLTSRQLFDSIYLGVINNTNTVPLYGVIYGAGDEGGDFIFIKNKQALTD